EQDVLGRGLPRRAGDAGDAAAPRAQRLDPLRGEAAKRSDRIGRGEDPRTRPWYGARLRLAHDHAPRAGVDRVAGELATGSALARQPEEEVARFDCARVDRRLPR